MKKMYAVWMALLLVLSVGGCTPNKKEEETDAGPKYDIGGKTYYNTVDEYGNNDHSKVWFGKDGSFVFTDNYEGGSEEISGSWSLNENVVTLDVAQSGKHSYSKILFEVKDEETLILKVSLEGSKNNQTFSVKEVKGSTVKKDDDNANVAGKTFYNASQDSKNKSYVEFKKDGKVKLADMNDFGIVEIEGNYEVELKLIGIVDYEPQGVFGETKAIFFANVEDGVLILENDLGVSRTGDVFTLDGILPKEYEGPMGDSLGNYRSEWKHKAISDVAEQYLPSVVFDSAGMFTFTENCYAGMASYIGWYEKKEDGFICHVDDASQLQGFKGDDVTLIEFERKGNTLILKTELCMSMIGDEFELVSERQ